MSSPTNSQAPQQQFLTLTAPIVSNKVLQRNPPAFFLPLAPATSASYPQAPASRAHERASVIPAPAEEVAPAPILRRSSSVSSGGSATSGYRVLKLGPVHWGEHLGEHKHDFHNADMP